MGPSVVTFSSSVPRKKDMKFEAKVTKSISGTSQFHWPPQTHTCASSERPSLITQSMQFQESEEPHGRSQRGPEQL